MDPSSKLNQLRGELNDIVVKLNQFELSNVDTNLNDIKKPENELKFKLNWQFKEKLVLAFNDFTSLLNGDINSNEKINEESNALIHYLVDLPLKFDDDENQTRAIDQLKPTLIIDLNLKNEVCDLLFRNKNFSIIYRDNVCDDAKLNLIKENNGLVTKLNNLPIKMLIEELSTDNKGSYGQLITKSDFDIQISKYEMEIAKLNDVIAKKNEVAFVYDFKDFNNFVSQEENIHICPSFNCLGLDCYLKIVLSNSKNLVFYIVLINDLASGQRVRVNGKLQIINQQKHFNDITIDFSPRWAFQINELVGGFSSSCKYEKLNSELKLDYLNNNGFIKDDKLILQFYMKADWDK